MNYVPLNGKQERSSVSPVSFHNASNFYVKQSQPVLNLPKPQFQLQVNGHTYSNHNQRYSHGIQDIPHMDIQKSNMYSSRTSTTFNTNTPMIRTNSPVNNVQQKLAALTLRLEKELESHATVDEYYGQCTKCSQPVTDSSDACQAMGKLYHNECFKCIVCNRILRGKTFYRIHDQVYCEEDYLVRGNK